MTKLQCSQRIVLDLSVRQELRCHGGGPFIHETLKICQVGLLHALVLDKSKEGPMVVVHSSTKHAKYAK
jgi:hypothetical protein